MCSRAMAPTSASLFIRYYRFQIVSILVASFFSSSDRVVWALSINVASSSRSGAFTGSSDLILYSRTEKNNNHDMWSQHRYYHWSWRKSTTKVMGGLTIDAVPYGNDDDHIGDDGKSDNNRHCQDNTTAPSFTPMLPPLSKDIGSSSKFPTMVEFSSPKEQQQQQQQQVTKTTNSSLLPAADDTTKKNTLSLFSASLSASLIYPLPVDDEVKSSGGIKASSSSLYSSSILDGVLPVSELFYRSTQSLVVDDSTASTATPPPSTTSYTNDEEEESIPSSTTSTTGLNRKRRTNANTNNGNYPIGGRSTTKNPRRSNLGLPSSVTTSSRFGDDEELPFSAEQSDRLTTKGINKINIRRNEADTFTTPFASSSSGGSTTSSSTTNDVMEHATSRKHSKTNDHDKDINSTTAANTKTTTTSSTAAHAGSASKKITSSYSTARPTSRYLKSNMTNKTTSTSTTTTTTTTLSTNSTRAGLSSWVSSPPSRRSSNQSNNKQRNISTTTSSGKIIRRGMEMLVGGEPINADPPLKSIEIRYDTSFVMSDWTQVITTTSRDFGPLLHQSSAELVSEVSKGLFCEYFVNSAIKWKVCPQEFADLVQEYENVTLVEHTNVTMGKKRSLTSRGGTTMLYQDILGRLTMEEQEQLKLGQRTTTNRLPPGLDDNNQNQKEEENNLLLSTSSFLNGTGPTQNDMINKTNEVSAASELLHNFPIFNSRRGFGKPHSSLLRGGGKKNRVNTQTRQKVEFSLCFDLNISRHDLMSGLEEDTNEGTVLKRILCRGISKAIRAEEMGYIVKINQLILEQEESGNTNVSLHFNLLPDHLRRFKNVQRDMMKMDRIFSQGEETQIDLSIGIASAAKEEIAWPPELRYRFVEEMFPPLNYDLNKENNDTSAEFLERSSLLRNGYMLKFELGVNKDELESVENGGDIVLRRVISNGIQRALRCNNVNVFITRLNLREVENGGTEVTVLLSLAALQSSDSPLQNEFSQINHALSEAVDSGDMCRSIAAAAREETAWPDHLCKTIAKELLVEAGDESILEEEEDGSTVIPEQLDTVTERMTEETSSIGVNVKPQKAVDGPFVPNNFDFDPEDLYLSGGNDGVFFDYSEQNIGRAPFQGKLGPLLMDAATERARQRQPRVIAIGDVHGCIDELQALLRRCCFQPGDLVVFLGDLVSKGPDSLSVVQMAREMGSFGVRGNHDFEVIRWHQAIMSGADPPMIGSEHFQIASCLSKADLKWLYSLPWYLSSKDLGALFVHAGFVPGIRLPKQNPRLMMNMRSILPDGTVTSKFFSNWAWSRLWDGPQTVLFGHDADRGLQQYEHALGLDTGCVYGGRLTACILPEKRFVSVSAKREYFQYRRKQFD